MDKINKIIKSLAEEDFMMLLGSVAANNADKSSTLLKYAREENFLDKECIQNLNIKANAFYTLKSRLNQKIESFLISKIEAPKMDLIQKVSYTSYLGMSVDKDIATVMLKKFEKELIDYDLPHELTRIYQSLKKLHISQPDQYYGYSQLYNKYVAYHLNLDKAEDLIGSYFNVFANYQLSRGDGELLQLEIMKNELSTLCSLYDSHRLFIYNSIVRVFHILFVPKSQDPKAETLEDAQDILKNVD